MARLAVAIAAVQLLLAGASAQAPQFFGGAFPSALPGAFSLPPLNPQIVQDWQSRLRELGYPVGAFTTVPTASAVVVQEEPAPQQVVYVDGEPQRTTVTSDPAPTTTSATTQPATTAMTTPANTTTLTAPAAASQTQPLATAQPPPLPTPTPSPAVAASAFAAPAPEPEPALASALLALASSPTPSSPGPAPAPAPPSSFTPNPFTSIPTTAATPFPASTPTTEPPRSIPPTPGAFAVTPLPVTAGTASLEPPAGVPMATVLAPQTEGPFAVDPLLEELPLPSQPAPAAEPTRAAVPFPAAAVRTTLVLPARAPAPEAPPSNSLLLTTPHPAVEAAIPAAANGGQAGILGRPVPTPATEGCTNLVDDLAAQADKSILTAALKATGLDAVLRSPSLVVTIFAPTNSAFQALLSQAGLTQADFLAPQRLDQVRQVLLYHVVPTIAARSSSLANNQQLPTLNGQFLKVDLSSPATLKVVPTGGKTAIVLFPDAPVCNALVHVVDTVLLPNGVAFA